MAKKKMGTVKTSTGSEYQYFWDDVSGDIYVGGEYAGNAKSQDEVWSKANYYATTLKIMQ
jgi:hypothetical protein